MATRCTGASASATGDGRRDEPTCQLFVRFQGRTQTVLRLPSHTPVQDALQMVLHKLQAFSSREFYLARNGRPLQLDEPVGSGLITVDLCVHSLAVGRPHWDNPGQCQVQHCEFHSFPNRLDVCLCSVHFRERFPHEYRHVACTPAYRHMDPLRVQAAGASWSSGLGEVVRVVAEQLNQMGAATRASEASRLGLHRHVNHSHTLGATVLKLLQINRAWRESVLASGPHVLDLASPTGSAPDDVRGSAEERVPASGGRWSELTCAQRQVSRLLVISVIFHAFFLRSKRPRPRL